MYRPLLLLILLSCVPATALADMYRWMDSSGTVHYSDTPVPQAEKLDARKFSRQSADGPDLPYATQRAMQDFPVTLYVGSSCGEICNQGRALLKKRGIPYTEKILKTQQDLEDFKKVSGLDGVAPVLQIGRNFLKGFLDTEWNSELDIAGYPKTASYRQLATTPAEPAQPAPSAAAPAVPPAPAVPGTPEEAPPEETPPEQTPPPEEPPAEEPAAQ